MINGTEVGQDTSLYSASLVFTRSNQLLDMVNEKRAADILRVNINDFLIGTLITQHDIT